MRILLVDDDHNFTAATCELLRHLGHEAEAADSLAEAREALQAGADYDLLMLDIMLPDGNGVELLAGWPGEVPRPRVAFITGHASIISLARTAVGPDVPCLVKPIDLDAIRGLLRAVAGEEPGPVGQALHFGELVGEAPCMHAVYEMIERVGGTDANVLIQGESGTGKELVARAIHRASGRAGEFVAANCGAISAELLGSELFGHEKGAFTGAVARKLGLFEQARGGTLFLDEITEMPLDMQPSLLRVLETGRLTRLGGTAAIEVDCRVVSATNRSPRDLVESQCLREDIYFRLAVFPIELPPLRQRPEDIPLLASYFLDQLNREHGTRLQLAGDALQRLQEAPWQGNIRELRHTLYRSFILTTPDERYLRLPEQLGSPFSGVDGAQPGGIRPGVTIQQMERELIEVTLDKVGGDKPRAAAMLGISLKTLYNRLNQYREEAS